MNFPQVIGCGFGILLTVVFSFLTTFGESNQCSMSYSRPVYHKFEVPSPHTTMGDRYSTHLYREGGLSRHYDSPDSLDGTPVLFIPGNAGSYSQGRSIAALSANLAKEIGSETGFDFFLVHFNEDFSAFLGKTLTDQAHYVNDAISFILDLYKGRQNPPHSVILIGHSMGGLVARIMVTLDNYIPHSVNTIYTLSTPHLVPPLTMDRGVTEVYDKVNLFWRQSFRQQDDSRLDDMTLVSISGGHTDLLVPPEFTPVYSIVPPSHGFSAYSYSIPNVWRGQDHLCIVWCYELRQVLVESLFAVADPNRRQRTKSQAERIAIFDHYLKSPLDNAKLINRNNALVWRPAPEENGIFDSPIGPLSIVAHNDPHPGKIQFNVTEKAYVSIFRLLFGVTVDVKTKFIDIPLPSLQTSLFAVKVHVEAPADEKPIAIRHWVPSTSESRWYDSSVSRIFWYSSSPFVPYPVQSHDCLHLQVLAPTHESKDSPIRLRIKIDGWASFANLLVRYRTFPLCFPAGIVMLIVLIQIHRSVQNQKCVPFKQAMDIFVKQYLTLLLLFSAASQYLLCFTGFRNFIRALQIPSERANIKSLNSLKYDIVDLFAGVDEPVLIFIAPMLLIVSVTAVIAVEGLFSLLVQFVLAPINRRLVRNTTSSHNKSRILECIKWAILTAIVVAIPHQCVFVGAALWHILQTQSTGGLRYTALMVLFWTSIVDVPIVAVWFRNFHFHLEWELSNLINVASAAPSVAFVYLINKSSVDVDVLSLGSIRGMRIGTYIFIGYFAYYALMHGFMHTFMMHYFANFLAGWLIFVVGTENKPEKKDL